MAEPRKPLSDGQKNCRWFETDDGATGVVCTPGDSSLAIRRNLDALDNPEDSTNG